MPTVDNNLRGAAHAALSSFLDRHLSSHDDVTAADVYRTMRDVANLLYEGQAVRDVLDSDPFDLAGTGGGGITPCEGRDDDEDEDASEEKTKNGKAIARAKVRRRNSRRRAGGGPTFRRST